MSTTLINRIERFSEAIHRPSTLVELLRWRATHTAEQLAYTYLIDDERQECFTYGELDRRARIIGAALQRQGATGERVLLLYPPGLEFIAAFFGCLFAGAVAVPAYPPRMNRSFRRLLSIVDDAQAHFALTTSTILKKVETLLSDPNHGLHLERLRWLDTDAITLDKVEDWSEPDISPDGLAFLQYTSGSTGTPKGVMLTHGNLLHNASLVHYGVSHKPGDKYVSWLPTFHDMGFMAGILQPLYGGFQVVLMSPLSFLQNPFRWLQAISRNHATTSGGPSFAYDLCVQKITAEQRATLDLSSWSVAFNGAEPIRHDAMERFTMMFEPCGFRPETFYPCYGLAEATLIVSGGRKSDAPVIKTVQARALERHVVVDASLHDDEPARALVGCGVTFPEQEIVIVRPESPNTTCAPDEVGEIWVSGPSIAQGYWNNPTETKRIFQAHLADNDRGGFLRTGDLGFLQDGELFVTGRLKDVIIIRGLNHYPQDIELTVEQCDAALRPGCGAAFSVDAGGEERLVVVQEVDWRLQPDAEALIKNIRQAVSEEHELKLHAVLLIKPKSIPKTSSGKIQRHACRAGFLAGSLDAVAKWSEAVAEAVPAQSDIVIPPAAPLEEWLRVELAARLGIDSSQIDVNEPIMRYGLDSLAAVELVHRIEVGIGINLPLATLLESPSIAQLAAQALAPAVSSTENFNLSRIPETSAVHSLSHGQQALWFLHRLAPESAAYNISSAVRIQGSLDIPALNRAFQALTDRHAALRTTFLMRNGKPVQQVHEHKTVHFEVADSSSWSQQELNQKLVEEALFPFDLESGGLMRVSLFVRSSSEHILVLTIHHLVADFWSLQVLVNELRELYPAEKANSPAKLRSLELQYTDYVRWRAEQLASAEGERQWEYWQQQLAGELPVLNLPTDRPRAVVQTYRGASHAFTLGEDLTQRLKGLAQDESATLYMILLAAFQVLLSRYTGQEEVLVGSPTTGRSRAPLAPLIGYFVNPVVLRADLSGNPTFAEFLLQVRKTACAAFEHQDYPFALLVERLQPERDPSRSPLFQAMFTLQQSNGLEETGLAAFALGEAGAQLALGDLRLESLVLKERVAQFDLTVMMAATDGNLAASFQYNADLFESATISRMGEHFRALIESIVAAPTEKIGSLPMLTEAERLRLFEAWTETRIEYPEQSCIHELFEAQVEKTPDAPAIIFEGTLLSYRELNGRANQLAHHLRGMGVGPDVLVGVCIERSLEMVVGLLGILKAGGGYVPLDPTYPKERLSVMLEDSRAPVLLTQTSLAESFGRETQVVCLDSDWEAIARGCEQNPDRWTASDDLAYVIYTSGSTGKPKGVMIQHRSVANFFAGMDSRVGCGPEDTMLAVTSISFDISVLELLWTLTRGARVVILSEDAAHGLSQPKRAGREKALGFSLFYFASADSGSPENKYKLLLEGVRFADQHDFEAVWTPERHFHPFGGLYPNPSVIGAALATVTERVGIRAGSVVMPLHNPIRVAEEWALVDNLSKGRVGLSFASGWHADDFVFFPDQYQDRKELMYRGIETVQQLWRGDSISARGGAGNEIKVKIYPQPIQTELPIWITAAGTPDTFIKAGEIGANLLTHLLGQGLEDVAEKIKLYRDSLARHGHDPQAGRVTLMLHTYLDTDKERVKEKVRVPFTNYLRTSVGLIANLAKSLNLSLDLNGMSTRDMDDLLAHAFDRYFETSALFGTPRACGAMIDQLKEIGVDEVACLIDFGVDVDSSLAGLGHLNDLRERSSHHSDGADYSLAAQGVRYEATLLQCTPSMMQLLSLNPDVLEALQSLRVLLLGGEALPPSLASQMKRALPCRLLNMYGPTETTIWSMTHEAEETDSSVSIGQPIANTQIYIMDRHGQPAPTGVAGELCIGGDGLARGYLNQPEMTAERFIDHPFAQLQIAQCGLKESREANMNLLNSPASIGARLYKTGDLARYRADGSIEFLGRIDQQVKIRGFRVELGEIEAVLAGHPAVRETVVAAREDVPGDKRLVAYVVPDGGPAPSLKELRTFLRDKLPEYMVPAHFVTLEALPWTANGKINRKALPAVGYSGSDLTAEYVAPQAGLEETVAGVWRQVLKVEKVGVHDNFFDLGGQSLLMAEAHSQLRNVLGTDLPLVKMLEHPTVSALARYLSHAPTELTFERSQDRAKKQRAGLLRQRQTVIKSRSEAQ